eukprot:TRINITY_DN10975_c0_g1_i11.p1 TRINITY_DN10975_c0_g1~~TRINITY_DN10975_c0_g1_i11.p1  ORF type:complete len:807 (+),score=107.70 TRINITY_DN10975_c0_g1_i11:379-2799(+)
MSAPTERYAAVVSLPETNLVAPDPEHSNISVGPGVSLPGGMSVCTPPDNRIHFRFKFPPPKLPDYCWRHFLDFVTPACWQYGADPTFCKQYHNFNRAVPVAARFPVGNVDGIRTLANVGPRERCVVDLTIGTASKLVLGNEASSRAVQVRWSIEGTCADLVTLWNEQNHPVGQSLVSNLPSLAPTTGGPGGFHVADLITLQYHWDADTPPLTGVDLKAVLALQPPEGTPAELTRATRSSHDDTLVDIQHRLVKLTCVPGFSLPDGYEDAWCVGLLLFSPGAPSNISSFWHNLLTQQMPTCIWNMERYGHFEPDQDSALAELSEKTRNLLVIVMNFPYHPQGATSLSRVSPSTVISQQALARHFPHSRSRFLVVSDFDRDKFAARSVSESGLSAWQKDDAMNCTADLLQAARHAPDLALEDPDQLLPVLQAAIKVELELENWKNDSEDVALRVALPSGNVCSVVLKLRASVGLLKTRAGLKSEQQLLFADEVLADSAILEQAGITDGALLRAIDPSDNSKRGDRPASPHADGRARRHHVFISKCSACCRPKPADREAAMQAELSRLREELLTIEGVRFNLMQTTFEDAGDRDEGTTFHAGYIDIHWEGMRPDDISARHSEAVRLRADQSVYNEASGGRAATAMHFAFGAALPGGAAVEQFKQRYNKMVSDGISGGLGGESVAAGGAALVHTVQREIESAIWVSAPVPISVRVVLRMRRLVSTAPPRRFTPCWSAPREATLRMSVPWFETRSSASAKISPRTTWTIVGSSSAEMPSCLRVWTQPGQGHFWNLLAQRWADKCQDLSRGC